MYGERVVGQFIADFSIDDEYVLCILVINVKLYIAKIFKTKYLFCSGLTGKHYLFTKSITNMGFFQKPMKHSHYQYIKRKIILYVNI